MKILFQPNQVRCEAEAGENLLQIADRANVLIDGSCGGTGTCGKCKVRVVSGRCNPLTDAESCLTEEEVQAGYRLACMTIPEDDLVVELPGIHKGSSRKKKMAVLPDDFVPWPVVYKKHVTLKKATMSDQRSDLTRLIDTLEIEGAFVDHHLLPALNKAVKSGNVTAVMDGKRILALEKGDTTDNCYGVAVDIGTTTVVAMLWDLCEKKVIEVSARTNPQSIYGADVISRIQYCNENEGNLQKMQQKIIDCINDMLVEMTQSCKISAQSIYDMTVVGNTTMSHLFLGVHPKPLARTPFAPVFCDAQDRLAAELGIRVSPYANVHFLPNIAGHVGADISSVMLAIGMKDMRGVNVAIDIGTNGEILLAHNGRILTCSTAAGPAFEGAEIFMGMRAADGAIERVTVVNGDIHVSTIENAPPIGICGSGLIDAVACLLKVRVLDAAGRMLSREEAEACGVAARISARIVEHEGKPAFVLANMENGAPILLTQNDIREVQLAKGAIYAGVATMMHLIGVSEAEIDNVILAGAFGNYINKHSASVIGLLPKVDESKIISVGNAAGAGACMALLSVAARKQIDEETRDVEHIELSNSMEFQDAYILAMGFPQ